MTLYDYLIALKIKIYLTYRFLNSVKKCEEYCKHEGCLYWWWKKFLLYALSFAR